MSKHEKVLKDPAPVVKVNELGDSSVNLIARPWAKTVDYWDVYWDLMRQVKERFDAGGINIPFPQRDLHIPGTIEVKLANGGGAAAARTAGMLIEPRPSRKVAVTEPAPAGRDDDDGDDETT
jgi:small-conductance mechanosensitive channel